MITFKQQITVPNELVQGLALSLGYKATIRERVENEDGTSEMKDKPNPETAIEFVDKLAKANTERFFLPFGRKLVEQQLAEAKAQLEQAIITPVKEALITEVVVSE